MTDLERIKKEMLRQAVRENVDTLAGKAPVPLRREGKWLRRGVRLLLLAGVPLVLFLSINAISVGGSSGPEVVVVPARSPAPQPEPAFASVPWPAPRPIDPTVFRLPVKTVVIDPGHGGSDPGANTGSGLTEKAVTLDVAQRLKALLVAAGYDVALTREKDVGLSLRERARFARERQGDVFLSIHVNSIPLTDRRAVESYYLGPTDEPELKALATAENSGAGYSLADFRSLLEGVYVGVRQEESRSLAQAIQAGLVAAHRKNDRTVEDRGVKSAPFVVLIASGMPAVLAEVSCLSNVDEARRLSDPEHRQRIAEALFSGLTSWAGPRNRGEEGRS